ncbi:MAG: hypothetical protein AAGD35_07425 [Actinomycetota bacterium]
MRFGGRYVLGIDALPRGRYAAVAVGRTITATFDVSTDGGLALPLHERVRIAVVEARAHCGAAPCEVRLVCIDDGDDGAEIEDLQTWLTEEIGASSLVLDMVGPVSLPAGVGVARTIDVEPRPERTACDELSVARACEAALW